jgi:sortase A
MEQVGHAILPTAGGLMRTVERILLITGIISLGLYGFFTVQAQFHQMSMERALDRELHNPPPGDRDPFSPVPSLSEGDLVGKLEIPGTDVSVMVMEGISDKTLRLGAGHIPGTPYPGTGGNSGIAAHRDTFFRGIRDIKTDDVIHLTTARGTMKYRVAMTLIVDPTDVQVLEPTREETITLVTCYPFYYIGPAPKRFVVHAIRVEMDHNLGSAPAF